MGHLEQTFKDIARQFTNNETLIQDHWMQIERAHSSKKRYYHSLAHLENLLQQLESVKTFIRAWDMVMMALFYHDIVYRVHRRDNESKSADRAAITLAAIQVPEEKINLCRQIILATKSHARDENDDVNYFTDADLSILGASWESYKEYAQNVRREYTMYPDFLYKPGRKKVIHHFLQMDQIFKTGFFKQKFEVSARENLQKELEVMGGKP
jgi:predicted metal-dependent HD superfamily phosphohydrolase